MPPYLHHPTEEARTLAIECPSCRREYDVTLFSFGRTIHCTCGTRVGLERRLVIPEAGPDPRFLADAMLGRLARWLRTLGYDTAWDPEIADEVLVRRALEEGRRILTRDGGLLREWRVEGMRVEAEKPVEQLREVVEAFDLPRPTRLFTRCRECNAGLEPVSLDDVADAVPEGVTGRLRAREGEEGSKEGPTLARCPHCERVYWEGSHTARMRAVLDRIFGEG